MREIAAFAPKMHAQQARQTTVGQVASVNFGADRFMLEGTFPQERKQAAA